MVFRKCSDPKHFSIGVMAKAKVAIKYLTFLNLWKLHQNKHLPIRTINYFTHTQTHTQSILSLRLQIPFAQKRILIQHKIEAKKTSNYWICVCLSRIKLRRTFRNFGKCAAFENGKTKYRIVRKRFGVSHSHPNAKEMDKTEWGKKCNIQSIGNECDSKKCSLSSWQLAVICRLFCSFHFLLLTLSLFSRNLRMGCGSITTLSSGH